MELDALIERLQELRKEHAGDTQVFVSNRGNALEFIDVLTQPYFQNHETKIVLR